MNEHNYAQHSIIILRTDRSGRVPTICRLKNTTHPAENLDCTAADDALPVPDWEEEGAAEEAARTTWWGGCFCRGFGGEGRTRRLL